MSNRRILVTLFSGNGLAQLIMMLFAPIISRVYSETAMGTYAACVTVITIVVKVASLSLEKAIPLERDIRSANKLMKLSFTIVWLISLVLFIFYIFFDISLLNFVGIHPSFITMILISLGIIFTSMIQIYNYQNMALEQYKTLSSTKGIQFMSTGVIQSALSFFQVFKSSGLLLGDVGGKLISILVLQHVAKKGHMEKVTLSWKEAVDLLRKHRNFILYSAPSGLINTLALQLPLLFVIGVFTSSDGGQYALVQRVIAVPISLLAISLAQFFYSFAAKNIAKEPEKVYELYMRLTWRLFIIMLVPMLLLFIFAPTIFPWVFGENWLLAGQLVPVLGGMFFSQAVFGATSQVLYIINKQGLQLRWECLKLICIIGVFMIVQVDFLLAMYCYGIVVSFFNAMLWYLGQRNLAQVLMATNANYA
ncbi:lipopolysaccharide biosynthesis protein [Listeria grandensis]|uniref:lipopolysaccharide biosynthesis protein n=1 Tax=Listeria grandensis TaxID=1494963 RepID=UPI00164D87C9|nr:hypothetical protein [Listeria grandensis]MBC6316186.1 hypothetical protein [Listeria grandensis]